MTERFDGKAPTQEQGEDEKQKLLSDIDAFLGKLKDENFEGKFWWDGHDDESGQKESDKYTDSVEHQELWKLISRAVNLGLVTEGEGFNLMVTDAAKELKEKLSKKEK